MFGIGFTELVLILIAALIFIGPKRMPEIAKAVGKAFMEFRKAAEGLKEQVTDFGSLDDSGGGYHPGPGYGADVPEGHSPPPSPEEPTEESGVAGPEGGAPEKPGSGRAESGDAGKKAAGKKEAAKKTRAKKAAPSRAGKKSSKSAGPGAGAKKGKKGGKSAKARAGRDGGNDTPA